MNLVRKTILLMVVMLMTAVPGYACMMDEGTLIDNNLDVGMVEPAAISLYNDAAQGNTDSITLFALNLHDPSLAYDLQFQAADSGDWMNFNPLFGPVSDSSFGLNAYTFDQAGIVDLDLRLFDGSNVVSESAALSFYDLQFQEDGQDWFSWAKLEWFDADGAALDVTTALWAWVPWDSQDLIGPEAVPIPGTGLLLMIGVVGLIGCRRKLGFRGVQRQ